MLDRTAPTSLTGIAVGSFEAIYEGMFGWMPQQYDRHVNAYNAFVRTYGNMEGFYLAKARKARERALQMETESGRAWIAKMNYAHSEYRRERNGGE